MPRRSTGTDHRPRPALLQLVTAAVLLAALAMGAVAAAVFMAFPCPCVARALPPNPKLQDEPAFQLPDEERIRP